MRYFFGDSTATPFATDYLQLLQDVMDYAEAAVGAGERVRVRRAMLEARRGEAERYFGRMAQMGQRLSSALVPDDDSKDTVGEGDPLTRLAESITRVASREVGLEVRRVRKELTEMEVAGAHEDEIDRRRGVDALRLLLQQHALPNTSMRVRVWSDRRRGYRGSWELNSADGLAVSFELDVAGANQLRSWCRVRDLCGSLRVKLPVDRTWYSRRPRMAWRRLGNYFVRSFDCSADVISVELCKSPHRGGRGYRIEMNADGRARGVQLHSEPERVEPPVELPDVPLTTLRRALLELRDEIASRRTSLSSAEYRNQAVGELADPDQPVPGILELIGPDIAEIASRSGSPSRLVLRQRDETGAGADLTLPRASIRKRIARLPIHLRGVFGVLGSTLPAPPPAPERLEPLDEGWSIEPGALSGLRRGGRRHATATPS